MGILKFLLICIEVVLLFNLLILAHEVGHYLAARWRGLVVEKFAIWFGKPLWKKTINGTDYQIGSIPAGGFVALPQLAPMEALEGESKYKDLPPIKPIDKIIVSFAGPLFSFLLAFAIGAVVWVVGTPVDELDTPRVGFIAPGSPAEKAGFQIGDTILKVDGEPVPAYSGTNGVRWRIVSSKGDTIRFLVERDGKEIELASGWEKPETSHMRRAPLRQIGIGPMMTPSIHFVVRNSPADVAGLRAGDLVLAANGVPVVQRFDLAEILMAHLGQPVSLEVERADGETSTLTLAVPADLRGGSALGIEWGRITYKHPTPWAQVADSTTAIWRTLDALFSPSSDVKASHLSGPVGIMNLYYRIFESPDGWRRALTLTVLISVNLGILNLLPFPVLDGGHILIALYSMIFRREIPLRILEIVQTACAVLLIAFMLYVTFYDVGDIVRSNIPTPTPAETSE